MSLRDLKSDVLFVQRLLKCGGFYNDILDSRWGQNSEDALKAFEAQGSEIARELGSFDARSEGNIATLHIPVQRLARLFMSTMAANGVEVRIVGGTRSYAEQDEIFAQGRTKPGIIVTNARGGHSNHNFGLAWDIAAFPGGVYAEKSPIYDIAGRVAQQAGIPGLEWGGLWTDLTDRPHYQLNTGLSVDQVRTRLEGGQPYTAVDVAPPAVDPPAGPAVGPNGRTVDQITGTDYLSPEERIWYFEQRGLPIPPQ